MVGISPDIGSDRNNNAAVIGIHGATLSIKPVMGAIKGVIIQKGQSVGIKKALAKMADIIVSEGKNLEAKVLYISHCNCPSRAKLVKELLLALPFHNLHGKLSFPDAGGFGITYIDIFYAKFFLVKVLSQNCAAAHRQERRSEEA